ncbi:PREDICTED: B3 domain-containing protein At5g60140-like [Camelina sativa]|uniref:B3 domain-containing protein At5g60140-like n=1 Tax=Camelina sativa TaxID=90675 RepID=A0ABM0XBW5_CAMSA|nr:PREDICTED: B3 domain-containing protein At5g60140-like [Camelina sativa]
MNQGTYSDGSTSKFFKAYLPGESGDDLVLPISFNSCLQKSLPKTVTVSSVSGKIWNMVLRKRGGDYEAERFVMVNGWKKIVKDEDLNGGDLLEFEFDGSRCFNFCIYEHETACKRIKRSSDQNEEINMDSDGEEDTWASNDVTALHDDDDDSEDPDYHDAAVEDSDDDNTEDEDGEHEDENDGKNPQFTVTLNPKRQSQLHIPAHVIKDYDLTFPERIKVVDKLGSLEKEIKIQVNGCVFVKGFGSVFRRNKMKTTDKMICEVKKTGTNLVHTIKVNIISG